MFYVLDWRCRKLKGSVFDDHIQVVFLASPHFTKLVLVFPTPVGAQFRVHHSFVFNLNPLASGGQVRNVPLLIQLWRPILTHKQEMEFNSLHVSKGKISRSLRFDSDWKQLYNHCLPLPQCLLSLFQPDLSKTLQCYRQQVQETAAEVLCTLVQLRLAWMSVEIVVKCHHGGLLIFIFCE